MTVANASPSALAEVLSPPCRQESDVMKPVCEKPVAYNPRLPHPAILYAALGGKDIGLTEYFDSSDMFVDDMYRRIGKGGNKVLLQEGEEVTFPSVNNGKRYQSGSNVASANDAATSQSLAESPKDTYSPDWKDDHVFGRSSSTGMNLAEATHQLHLLRNIHLTAQQQVTGEDEVAKDLIGKQAANLIGNIAALVHLTENVKLRQPIPAAGIVSSASEHDSGFTSKTQQKRARKMARRGEHKRQGPPFGTQVQPRHLNSRSAPQKNDDYYARMNRSHDQPPGCPEGVSANGMVYYSPEAHGTVPSAVPSYPNTLQYPYYSWPSDQSSHASFSFSGPAWHTSVCKMRAFSCHSLLICHLNARPTLLSVVFPQVQFHQGLRLDRLLLHTSPTFAVHTGSRATVHTDSVASLSILHLRLITPSRGTRLHRWKIQWRVFTCKNTKTFIISRIFRTCNRPEWI